MDRASLDRAVVQPKGPYRILDRVTGEEVVMSTEDLDDLCRVHFYDFMEQVARVHTWDYRRPGYRNIAKRLGSKAEQIYERVFAQEKQPQLAG